MTKRNDEVHATTTDSTAPRARLRLNKQSVKHLKVRSACQTGRMNECMFSFVHISGLLGCTA